MALKLYNDTDIQNIANSIRAKTGKSATMLVSEMSSEIDSISSTSSAGFLKGTYQSTQVWSNQHKITADTTTSLGTRLYEILDVDTTNGVIRCSQNDIYSQSFSDVSVGYLDDSGSFVSVANGSRSSLYLSFNLLTNTEIVTSSFVIMRDNTNSKLYIVCLYYVASQTYSIPCTGVIPSTSAKGLGRPYEISSSIPYAAGDGTHISISKPVFKWENGSIRTDPEMCGIVIS